MTRIVVVESDGAGGMIHYAHQLCAGLSGAGAQVTLITSTAYELAGLPHEFEVLPMMHLWPLIEPSRPTTRLGKVGTRLHHKVRRVWRGILFARAWNRVTNWILAEHPDVAQFGAIRFPFQAFYLRRLRRAGVAVTQVCHEFEPREVGSLRRWVHRRLSTRVYRCFDVIFLHTRENADRFLDHFAVDPSVIHIIPHGNEAMFLETSDAGGTMHRHYRIPSERPTILFFGGLRPSKGIPDLITAFSGVIAEIDAHLVVAGPPAGVDPDEFRRQAAQLGVEDRVIIDDRYLPLAEVGPLMRTATVVALPYRTATASGVLQVAYAYARPVVATAVGALATDVVDGDTGLIVPAGDSDAMARALLKILSDPVEANEMGQRAQQMAMSEFAWEPIADAMLGVYRESRR
jgi:glycosyltransferase involved in cell wall biosynthesis